VLISSNKVKKVLVESSLSSFKLIVIVLNTFVISLFELSLPL